MQYLRLMCLLGGSVMLAVLMPVDSILGTDAFGETPVEVTVRYENLARTFEVVFAGGYGTDAEISAVRPSIEQERAFRERLGYAVYDCSDADYRCIAHLYSVFAVPRKSLVAGMTYTAGGAQLTVEECMRDSGESCQVALISSDCQVLQESNRCQVRLGGRNSSSESGPMTYFVFNEDYGVTAFGRAGKWIESPDERLQTAKVVVTQLLLRGNEGLLKAQIETIP